jgi:hypothetical protein
VTRAYRTSQVWKEPDSLAFAEPFRAYGGVVCPVLIGFGLTAIITLELASVALPAADFAVASFAISVVCLALCMQLAGTALLFTAPPSAHLDWAPEARFDESVLEERRRIQGSEIRTARLYASRVGKSYNAGLIAFLMGCLFVSLPNHLTLLTAVAPVAFIAALILECAWIFWRPTWLVPTRDSVAPELNELDAISLRSILGDP